MQTISPQIVFKQQKDIVSRSIAGETILVPIRGELADMEKIFSLEEVGEFIWQQIDGTLTLRDIRDQIIRNFEVEPDVAEKDVEEFVRELQAADLIVEVV